jgi:hypothetical protein
MHIFRSLLYMKKRELENTTNNKNTKSFFHIIYHIYLFDYEQAHTHTQKNLYYIEHYTQYVCTYLCNMKRLYNITKKAKPIFLIFEGRKIKGKIFV